MSYSKVFASNIASAFLFQDLKRKNVSGRNILHLRLTEHFAESYLMLMV